MKWIKPQQGDQGAQKSGRTGSVLTCQTTVCLRARFISGLLHELPTFIFGCSLLSQGALSAAEHICECAERSWMSDSCGKNLSSGKARSQGRRRAPLVLSECLQPWKKLLRQKVYLQNLGSFKAYKKLGKLLQPARTESTSGFRWNHAAWKQNSVSAIATLPGGSGHTKCHRKQPALYNCTVTVGKMSAKVVLKVGLGIYVFSICFYPLTASFVKCSVIQRRFRFRVFRACLRVSSVFGVRKSRVLPFCSQVKTWSGAGWPMKISEEIYESPTASSKLQASKHVFRQVLGLQQLVMHLILHKVPQVWSLIAY